MNSINERLVTWDEQETSRRIQRAFQALGSLESYSPETRTIEGKFKFGLSTVKLVANLFPSEKGVLVRITASVGGKVGGWNDAIERVFSALPHVDDINWKPDRFGASAGQFILAILFLVGFMTLFFRWWDSLRR